MLQETHGNAKTELRWLRELGQGDMFFSHWAPNARGVLTFISAKSEFKVASISEIVVGKDDQGRLLLVKGEFKGESFCIMNCYMPNLASTIQGREKCKEFVDKIDKLLREHANHNCQIVLGG